MVKKIIIVMMSILTFFPFYLKGQDQKIDKEIARQEEIQAVEKALQTREYTIRMQWAVPGSGRSINITSEHYTLKVSGDNAKADLPFFGRGYSASFNDGGIIFDAVPEEYETEKIEKGKKSRTEISFKVRSETDSHTVRITVYPEGNASVYITSGHRSSMNYRGALETAASDKASDE